MKKSTRVICINAMFVALIAVLSFFIIPTPIGVPFTLQTFAIALSGYVLGKKNGVIVVVVYLIIGLVGVPIYAGMQAGPGVLFGPAGGFLWGFLFLSFFCGFAIEKKGKVLVFLFPFCGLLCCHICGIIQLQLVSHMSWISAIAVGSIPYIIKDIISISCALGLSYTIRKNLFC